MFFSQERWGRRSAATNPSSSPSPLEAWRICMRVSWCRRTSTVCFETTSRCLWSEESPNLWEWVQLVSTLDDRFTFRVQFSFYSEATHGFCFVACDSCRLFIRQPKSSLESSSLFWVWSVHILSARSSPSPAWWYEEYILLVTDPVKNCGSVLVK